MTKLEIEAIRKLPKEYVADDTCTCLFNGLVIAMNADLLPLKYEDGLWKALEANHETRTGPVKPL